MSLNFPSSPATNDLYTLGTRTWRFNGAGWAVVPPQGELGYTGSKGDIGLEPWKVVNSDYTASNRDRLIANATAGSFNITLPETPTVGDYIQITDGANFELYPITILRNGNTIEGFSENVLLDLQGSTFEFIYDGATWQLTSTTGPQGFTGSRGDIGFTGSNGAVGPAGTSVTIVGSVATAAELPDPYNGDIGDGYIVQSTGFLWIWNGTAWIEAGQITGYTGSKGDVGFTGSQGAGFTGSQGNAGSIGFTGSQGIAGEFAGLGYTGSQGFTGSFGNTGFTGSFGDNGFTGSRGNTGFTGSQGTPGEAAAIGYTGSLGGFDSQQEIVVTTATTYTLSLADIGKLIALDNTSQIDVVIPDDSVLTVNTGQRFDIVQYNTGPVSVETSGAASVYAPFDAILNEQYAVASIVKIAANEWIFVGPQAAGYTGSIGFTGSQGAGFTGSQGYTGSLGGFESQQDIVVSTGTTYTLSLSDIGKLIALDNVLQIDVVIPDDSVLSVGVGQRFDIVQYNTGPVSVEATGSASLYAPFDAILNEQYAVASIIKIAANEWIFVGPQAAGYTGSIGFTGSRGNTGFTGSQGDVGFTGSAGVDGIIGVDGVQGYTGSQGFPGYGSVNFLTRNYTGDGTTVNFTITDGLGVDNVFVFENGVMQFPTTDYTVAGTDLSFVTAPATGVAIQIRELNNAGSAGGGGATGAGGDQVFYENDQTVTTSYAITSGKSALTAGPITIADGAIVTIPTGSRWVIL